MPINKKAYTRFLAYDRCLRNHGRKYTWENLLEEANKELEKEGMEGISRTQVFLDIKYMKESSWEAPIEKTKDGRTAFYRYSDKKFSISGRPLNETEEKQFRSALSFLSRFDGQPQFDWVNGFIPFLEKMLPGLNKESKPKIIGYETNIDYVGLKFIGPLFNAIANKRVVKILYQDFYSEFPYEIEFHPYYLKQYNNRWFSFGNNPKEKKETWTLALDRIKQIDETNITYIESEINWDDYFSDFIGVTKMDGEIVEVKFLITDHIQAKYIETKPLHETQKQLKRVEGGFETSIKVIPNVELEKLILSFGEKIKVISPSELKIKISERIIKSSKLYAE